MSEKGGASTFSKGLVVLSVFETVRGGVTMAEIARRTGFDRAVTRRLCLSLEEAGYLDRDGNRLSLAPRLLAIAGGYLASEDIGRIVQPVLNHHAAELGGEITLAVRDDLRAIYIAQSAAPSARVSIGFTMGSTIPLLTTSIGRMLLAAEPPEVARHVLEQAPPAPHTDKTCLDPDEIAAEIERARSLGYAHVAGEFERGVAALAIASHLPGGRAVALGTTGTEAAFKDEANRQKTLDILRAAARALAPR